MSEDQLRWGRECADRYGEQHRRGGHDAPGPLEARRDRLGVGEASVARLLDPRQQEHAVVGGEAEADREQQDRLGGVERAVGPVGQQPFQGTVLEDHHEDAEHGAEAQRYVHQHRLYGQHHGAGHQEQDDQRRGDHETQREREMPFEAGLEINERGAPGRRHPRRTALAGARATWTRCFVAEL